MEQGVQTPGRDDEPVTGRVTTRTGAGGARGLVHLEGVFDLDLADAVSEAVDALLAGDVGEVWVDLRQLTSMASIGGAVLLRCRRRAARMRARMVLVTGAGPIVGVLDGFGLSSAFAIADALPPDLQPRAATPLNGRRRVPSSRDVPAPVTHVSLLSADPDLADRIDQRVVDDARRQLVAPVAALRRGVWDGEIPGHEPATGLGVLILDGLLLHRVGEPAGYGAELLGPGDVVRGGVHPGAETTPWLATVFHVIQTVHVAVLDAVFARRARDYPAVYATLLDRAMARAHVLTVAIAATHYTRIEQRLHVLLWTLAQRWGRVSSSGVVLRLPLTHAVLADLTGARRPSVTIGLQHLDRAGLLSRRDGEWILHGDPPGATTRALAGRSAI